MVTYGKFQNIHIWYLIVVLESFIYGKSGRWLTDHLYYRWHAFLSLCWNMLRLTIISHDHVPAPFKRNCTQIAFNNPTWQQKLHDLYPSVDPWKLEPCVNRHRKCPRYQTRGRRCVRRGSCKAWTLGSGPASSQHYPAVSQILEDHLCDAVRSSFLLSVVLQPCYLQRCRLTSSMAWCEAGIWS